MKLVDILATELKEWPEGVECATQDPDKEIRFRPGIRFDFYSTSLADDAGADFGEGAEVTRDQWQAAVYALKVWNGEGLPPVGTKVRIGNFPGNKWLENFQGREAVIIAHDVTKSGEASAVFKAFADNGYPRYHALAYEEGNFLAIRPLKTAEQVALKEIEEVVDGYNVDIDCSAAICATVKAMLDAGYRKQVQP